MKMNRIIISVLAVSMVLASCKKEWEEHYETIPVTVNENMWEVIQQDTELGIDRYVQYIKDFKLDTLFKKDATYTLFIPTNEAFDDYLLSDSITESLLMYLITPHYVQSGNITGSERVQMLSEKFALFEHYNNTSLFDGIVLEKKESPLYLNGKYFVMTKRVPKPKPNLFEFYANTNPIFKKYILDLDTVIVDKEKSRPLYKNDLGQTVYDTVPIIKNEFEEKFFPIREEFRFNTATMVFPRTEDYNRALDDMASLLTGYQDHTDIPVFWQNDILIPYLLEHGVFENSLNAIEFIRTGAPNDTLKLKNILGDSIVIDYDVGERYECSNGIAFNYKYFQVPDTLFNGSVRVEMEWYVKETGIDRYIWRKELATQFSDKSFLPNADSIPTASNDSIVKVFLESGYAGNFSVELKIKNLFPRRYLIVFRTMRNYGAIFDIYLNDQLIKTMDWGDYFKTSYLYRYPSEAGGWYYIKQGDPYRMFDVLAENTVDYGETTLRFEYVGPAEFIPNNSLLIDYIDFIPYYE
ncbi:MAG: fasciclin domain-containing protein [Bacteroidales bacterium]|nr:fasciclin domain-containing protein [Bacteroidales bacterium]